MISLKHIPTRKSGIGIVYSILSLTTGRMYIGGTQKNRIRIAQHFHELRRGSHYNKKLQSDFNIHGEDDFVVHIILLVHDSPQFRLKKNLLVKETEAIHSLRPYYNICYKGFKKLKAA